MRTAKANLNVILIAIGPFVCILTLSFVSNLRTPHSAAPSTTKLAMGSSVGTISSTSSDQKSFSNNPLAFPVKVPIPSSTTALPHRKSIAADYGKLPLTFEPNQGQTDAQVKFLSHGNGYSLFLTADEAVISLKKANSPRPNGRRTSPDKAITHEVDALSDQTAIHMQLAGATYLSDPVGVEQLPGKSNYFLGNDPSKWRTNVPTFAKVNFQQVYPGVDLIYYGNQGQLEYDFVVAAGANPKQIQLEFQDAGWLRVNDAGDLLLGATGDQVRFQKPLVYQFVAGEKKLVKGKYTLTASNSVGFQVGDYDHNQPLVIDPVLLYSTYLGGTGNIDSCEGIAVDVAGEAYVVGTATSTDFPTANSLQSSSGGGGSDAFIAKFNASGTALIYSTYLGGSGRDGGYAIALDPYGNAYVAGSTTSSNFPTVKPIQAAFGGGATGNDDGFVTELSADGSSLIYSTYLGGNQEDSIASIAVDAAGNAYVTGATESTNFPIAHALQPLIRGIQNAFVAKIAAGGASLVYSTYLGGSGAYGDYAAGIAVDSSGNAYVTGNTNSPDFPVINAIQPFLATTLSARTNAFITKFNPDGSALLFSTYLGGDYSDFARGIALDSDSNIYIAGTTQSNNFPLVNPLPTPVPPASGFFDFGFASKLKSDGSALVYSTYIGGTSSQSDVNAIAVDSSGSAYLTGATMGSTFPTVNAVQPTYGGGSEDAFLMELNAGGSALLYSSYLGGSLADYGQGIALDSGGNIYVTGQTASTNFPTVNPFQSTLKSIQTSNDGGSNGFVSKFGNVQNSPTFSLAGLGTLTYGAAPFSVATDFTSSSPGAVAFALGSGSVGCSVTPDGTVTITAATTPTASSCIVSVSQCASGPYAAVGPITSSFPIAPASLTITANSLSKTFGQTLNFAGTEFTSSGLVYLDTVSSVSLTSTGSVATATVSGGPYPIIPSAASGTNLANYSISYVNGTLIVLKAGSSSTITLVSPSPSAPGQAAMVSFAVTGTGSPSGLVTVTATTGETCAALLSAGAGSCSITFATVGTRTLTATYAGDANFIGSTSPGVAQSVIGPLVSFSPASLNFGNVYLGLPSVRSIALTNVGNASVSIANVQISGGNDSAAFKVLSLCPSVLAAGKSCQLIVTLLPTGSNYSPTATLVVTDSAFGSPQSVPLSATVINPKASLSTYDLNFGKQTVSTSSSSEQVTLTNIGTTPLTLSSFTTAGDFAVAPGGSCADAESIAPGAACTIAIAFKPEAKGLRLGTVTLKDNALLGEQIVLLTGVGD